MTIGFLAFKPDRLPGHGAPPRQPGRGEPAAIIIERLHFNQPQQRAFQELRLEHQKKSQQLREEMATLFRRYYGLLAAPQPDSSQAEALSQQIADNQRAQAQLNFDHFKQIKALCGPDQRADFNELVRELAHLFGRPQRPPHLQDGPPENLPDAP